MPSSGNPAVDALLIYGPLGILLALFILGWVVPKATLERERGLTDVALGNNAKLATSIDRQSDALEAVLRDRAGG